jgi:hypothetical protein
MAVFLVVSWIVVTKTKARRFMAYAAGVDSLLVVGGAKI